MATSYTYSNGVTTITSSNSSDSTSTLDKALQTAEEKQPSPKRPTNSLYGDIESAASMKRHDDSMAGLEEYRQNMQGIRDGSGHEAPRIKPSKPYGVITGDDLIAKEDKDSNSTLLSTSYSFSELVRNIVSRC